MEEKKNIFQNKKLLIILPVLLLIVAVIGITYAFFNYTRTGANNTIQVGRISFNTTQASGQDGQITLTNVFPITRTAAASDTDNSGEVVITITGDTDYSGGVEYLVTATGVTNTVGGKNVPISVIVTPSAGLGTASGTYYTARNSAESHIYKVEAGDTIEDNGRLLVGYIVPNSTPGTASGINGTLTIKAFIDKDKIAITDTYPQGTVYTVKSELGESDIAACTAALTGVTGVAGICDTSAHLQAAIDAGNVLDAAQITALENAGLVTEYTDGTLSTWVNGRTVLTTTEWNSLISSGISFKVKVEANEGIWVENPNTLYNKVKAMSNGTMNSATDFGTVASSDTTNHPYGVYQLAESGLANPIYFYRGDHTVKNNVIFDNKCWLVVRTTETNSTRMIYNGTPTDGKCTTTTGNNTMISLYQSGSVNLAGNYDYSTTPQSGYTLKSGTQFKYNVNYDNAKYVGYTYDNGVSSNMKNALEAWYEGAISSEAKAKIETSTYCNDIRVDASETSYTKFMPATRAGANTPSVLCPDGANAISSKVGFLTVDEEILAGRTSSSGMEDYLYNISSWWLGSPNNFDDGYPHVFVVKYANNANNNYSVDFGYGLRPVISILSNTEITGGDGSQLTPWVIG